MKVFLLLWRTSLAWCGSTSPVIFTRIWAMNQLRDKAAKAIRVLPLDGAFNSCITK